MSDLAQKAMKAAFEQPFSVLQASVRAVLKLHQTDRGDGPDPDGRCFECAEIWPCPTVKAIADTLRVSEDPEG